jgi:DNA-directed RNA polymerase subunit RPC12/RpoP
MKAVSPYTYDTYYFCSNGCGPDKGWIEHGKQRISKRGTYRCPYCGQQLRTKSRFSFGAHRLGDDPERL